MEDQNYRLWNHAVEMEDWDSVAEIEGLTPAPDEPAADGGANIYASVEKPQADEQPPATPQG